MMHPVLQQLDDLSVVSGDLQRSYSCTLTGIVRNEMHFLPVFLPHYRALGIDRFILLDDQSTDETRTFLADQPDVVVLSSKRRFGDRITQEQADSLGKPRIRMHAIWRALLLEKYCAGEWSVHVDVDEFLDLPAGTKISDLTKKAGGSQVIWTAMIDMYPKDIGALKDMQNDVVLDLGKDWFFDGRPHLALRGNERPKTVYPGSRCRLMLQHGFYTKRSAFRRFLARNWDLGWIGYNNLRKAAIIKWQAGAEFTLHTACGLEADTSILLPLRHFKFYGGIYARAISAVDEGMYADNSMLYDDLTRLLRAMDQANASFICKNSTKFTGFNSFHDRGLAVGI